MCDNDLGFESLCDSSIARVEAKHDSERESCEGFEIEPCGPMSGCDAKFTGADDCPVCGPTCHGTGVR